MSSFMLLHDRSLKVVLVVVTLTYCSLHFCKMCGHFDAIYRFYIIYY